MNESPNVVLFGARGWIGQQLIPILEGASFNVHVPPDDVRADDEVKVRTYLESLRPTHVISSIGRTYGPGCSTIDYLEDEPGDHSKMNLNMRDNLYAPLTLAIICQQLDIHFTYIGTGCIFSYNTEDKTDTFNEADDPNFTGSAYSTVKGYTDRIFRQLMKSNKGKIAMARIRMPIVEDLNHPRNFITKITRYDKVCSIENSMSVLPTLLPVLVDIIKNNFAGTINLTNPGTISHNRILEMYKEIVDPNFTWTNFTVEEQNKVLKSQRSNNHLDTSLLQSYCPDVPDIEQAIKTLLEKWAQRSHH